MDAGGQFGPGSARGDGAELREIRSEGDLDGHAQGAGEALRSVIRSVPSASRVRSTTTSGSGPPSAEARTVPTKRARYAATIRACTASGSRPATRTWQRDSVRRPAR